MDKKDYGWTILAAIGISAGSIVLMLIAMLYGGFVTMKLWNGIISPTFDLIQLNFFQAWGLDVFVSYIIAGNKLRKTDNDDSIWGSFSNAIVLTTAFWLVGMIIMYFI